MRAIFTYHSIDSSGSPISVSEETFRTHVRFFGSGRVAVVPLAELPSTPDETDALAITFDDGFLNFTSTAMPLLSHLGFPATVFVVSDAAGGSNAWGGTPIPGIPTLPLMGWPDLARARDAGFEIAAHTRHHLHLTGISLAQAEDEISGCVDRISSELGERPRRFAYPYGDVNDAVAAVARQTFEHSVTTKLDLVRPDQDRALLPRLDAYYFRRPGTIESWGTAAFRRRLWIRAQGRKVRSLMSPANRGQ
jgi:hypothetical protein